METKTFRIVSSTSLALTIAAAVLSIIGIAITGFYTGIIVLVLIAMIPVLSRYFAKGITQRTNNFQRRYFTTFTIINVLSILVVIWMSFVILVDRVFSKIL